MLENDPMTVEGQRFQGKLCRKTVKNFIRKQKWILFNTGALYRL